MGYRVTAVTVTPRGGHERARRLLGVGRGRPKGLASWSPRLVRRTREVRADALNLLADEEVNR